jgi:hypothetical protein
MLTLLLLACNCPHKEALVGGCVLLDSFTEGADTATVAQADTGAGDTAAADADVRVTSVRATVSAVSQLDSAENPDSTGAARGVHGGFNGPWTHLALDLEDGSTGDAWFIAGAPTLIAAGETVALEVREYGEATEFSISGADGTQRLWVGEAGGMEMRTELQRAGATVEIGAEACVDQDRCQTTRYHDIDVTDPDGTFSVPLGGTLERGADVYINGGATSYDHVSTAWSCGETWGLGDRDQLALAAVSGAAFDSEALWP